MKFKNVLYVFLFITFFMSLSCYAENTQIIVSGVCGDNSSWTLYENGKVTISGFGSFQKIDFGENINKVTNIEIESGITSIPERAFEGNHYVSKIVIPDTVTEIGYRAFAACLNMNSYEVDKNNEYYSSDYCGVLYDKDKTVLIQYPVGNKDIEEYRISDGVKTIGDSSFGGGKVQNLYIPNTVTNIEKSAFQYFGTDELNIPSSVEIISEYGFYGCAIKKVLFNEGLKTIGARAFDYSDNIAEINIPKSVISIGSQAFDGCSNLKEIKVHPENENYCAEQGVLFNKDRTELIQYPIGNPNGLYIVPNTTNSVGALSFWSCRNIKEIIIPSSVTTIKEQAFSYCTNLEKIYFSVGINTIEHYAFNNCIGLKDVFYTGTSKQWGNIYIGSNDGSFMGANYHFEISYPLTSSGYIEAYLNNSKIHIKSDFDLKNSTIILAEYNENDIFQNLLSVTPYSTKNYLCIDAPLPENGYYKIFVWKDLTTLCPQTNSIKLTEDFYYDTDKYEEVKLLYLINTLGAAGVHIAIHRGYYDGILKERFYKGDSQKISDFIAESGKIYDYVQFENLLRQGIAKYSGTSGGHGWS